MWQERVRMTLMTAYFNSWESQLEATRRAYGRCRRAHWRNWERTATLKQDPPHFRSSYSWRFAEIQGGKLEQKYVSSLNQIQIKTKCADVIEVTCIFHTIHDYLKIVSCLVHISYICIYYIYIYIYICWICAYTCAIVLIRDSMVCCCIWD